MRVLLIKTSSMGDIIHTLPALTDAQQAIHNIQFDWVVEDSFAEIPAWHPAVNKVIPVALRRWRKGLFSSQTRAEWRLLREQLNESSYDLILDAQGLVKSAFLGLLTRGVRAGLDFKSARESFASFMYQRKYTVDFYQHAIVRMRSLFSLALNYSPSSMSPDFGINRQQFNLEKSQTPYLVFLHGTTWGSKQWPELYWIELAKLVSSAGFRIKISGASEEEIARARRMAAQHFAIDFLPRLSISNMASLLANAKAVVAVDTGFGHLAAALSVPTVSIYGPTNPEFTGAIGKNSLHLSANFPCAPCLNRTCTYRKPASVTPACYTDIPPEKVFAALQNLLSSRFNHS